MEAQGNQRAVVLFSGGQDSTTCPAWALERYAHVETMGFDYGQRHSVELAVRPRILANIEDIKPGWLGRLGSDHVVKLDFAGLTASSLLTGSAEVDREMEGVPSTFVPGRNLIFLLYAAILACRRDIKHIIIGACETDYSGYPDCRDDTIKAMQIAVNLGLQARFAIHAPLMWINKAETWALAEDIGGSSLIDMIREMSHTCYAGDREHLQPWGYGCSACDACRLREGGWLKYQAQR